MNNTVYAFMIGYLEGELRHRLGQEEAEKIIARVEEKAAELYDDFELRGKDDRSGGKEQEPSQ